MPTNSDSPISIRLTSEVVQRVDALAELEDRNRSNMIAVLVRRATDERPALDILRELAARFQTSACGEERQIVSEQLYLAQHLIRKLLGDALLKQALDILQVDEVVIPSKPWL